MNFIDFSRFVLQSKGARPMLQLCCDSTIRSVGQSAPPHLLGSPNSLWGCYSAASPPSPRGTKTPKLLGLFELVGWLGSLTLRGTKITKLLQLLGVVCLASSQQAGGGSVASALPPQQAGHVGALACCVACLQGCLVVSNLGWWGGCFCLA